MIVAENMIFCRMYVFFRMLEPLWRFVKACSLPGSPSSNKPSHENSFVYDSPGLCPSPESLLRTFRTFRPRLLSKFDFQNLNAFGIDCNGTFHWVRNIPRTKHAITCTRMPLPSKGIRSKLDLTTFLWFLLFSDFKKGKCLVYRNRKWCKSLEV